MRLRRLAALLVACAFAPPAAAETEPDAAAARALHDFAHAIGTLGYVYGAPLLDLAIAEYRQTHRLASDVAGPRGVLAHADGGGLPTPETSWLPWPNPDALHSSAWLDLSAQPYVLWIPPMDGVWYDVQLEDAFANIAANLSSRTIGSVGGWYAIAPETWDGEFPPGLMEVVRMPTQLVWLLLRIAATPENAAQRHERYQRQFKLLPLDVYARNPKAAALAASPAQPRPTAALRAAPDRRGTLDAFRIVQQRLRDHGAPRGDEALLALFDRAGFGPNAALDGTHLPQPQLDGLRTAARDAERALAVLRVAREPGRNGWSARNLGPAPGRDDLLGRATRALGASAPEEVAEFELAADSDGRALDGRNDYTLRFAEAKLPPGVLWSIAAYAADTGRLVDTRAGHRSIGAAPDALVHEPDGSVVIRLSSSPPDEAAPPTNWLPIPTAPVRLVGRIYQPLPAVLEGRYAFPPALAEP